MSDPSPLPPAIINPSTLPADTEMSDPAPPAEMSDASPLSTEAAKQSNPSPPAETTDTRTSAETIKPSSPAPSLAPPLPTETTTSSTAILPKIIPSQDVISLHQESKLTFIYDSPNSSSNADSSSSSSKGPSWTAKGQTTIYFLLPDSGLTHATDDNGAASTELTFGVNSRVHSIDSAKVYACVPPLPFASESEGESSSPTPSKTTLKTSNTPGPQMQIPESTSLSTPFYLNSQAEFFPDNAKNDPSKWTNTNKANLNYFVTRIRANEIRDCSVGEVVINCVHESVDDGNETVTDAYNKWSSYFLNLHSENFIHSGSGGELNSKQRRLRSRLHQLSSLLSSTKHPYKPADNSTYKPYVLVLNYTIKPPKKSSEGEGSVNLGGIHFSGTRTRTRALPFVITTPNPLFEQSSSLRTWIPTFDAGNYAACWVSSVLSVQGLLVRDDDDDEEDNEDNKFSAITSGEDFGRQEYAVLSQHEVISSNNSDTNAELIQGYKHHHSQTPSSSKKRKTTPPVSSKTYALTSSTSYTLTPHPTSSTFLSIGLYHYIQNPYTPLPQSLLSNGGIRHAVLLTSLPHIDDNRREYLNKVIDKYAHTSSYKTLKLLPSLLSLPTLPAQGYTLLWLPNPEQYLPSNSLGLSVGGMSQGCVGGGGGVGACFVGGCFLPLSLLPSRTSKGTTAVRTLPYYPQGQAIDKGIARGLTASVFKSKMMFGKEEGVSSSWILDMVVASVVSLGDLRSFGEGFHFKSSNNDEEEDEDEESTLNLKKTAKLITLESLQVFGPHGMATLTGTDELDFPTKYHGHALLGMLGGGAIISPDSDSDSNSKLYTLLSQPRITSSNTFLNRSDYTSSHQQSESTTPTLDQHAVYSTQLSDAIESIERSTSQSTDGMTPNYPSAYNGVQYITSNGIAAKDLGCTGVEMIHPNDLGYRGLKSEGIGRVLIARVGVRNFFRAVRVCCMVACGLGKGVGGKEMVVDGVFDRDWVGSSEEKEDEDKDEEDKEEKDKDKHKPAEHKKQALLRTKLLHTLATMMYTDSGVTSLAFVSLLNHFAEGSGREGYLKGSLIDPTLPTDFNNDSNNDNDDKDKSFVPANFPNCYLKTSSPLHLRVIVHVSSANDISKVSKSSTVSITAEQHICTGNVSFSGPLQIRVVESDGKCREFKRLLSGKGRVENWGGVVLNADNSSITKRAPPPDQIYDATSTSIDYTANTGYQAIEQMRQTNPSTLCWVRVDPHGVFGVLSKVAVFQPDACEAEMLFYDGDCKAQVGACRALAEKPINGSVSTSSSSGGGSSSGSGGNDNENKTTHLPLKILSDCLRGTAAHTGVPHNPSVRANAALCIGQWQNNKAPLSREGDNGRGEWIGLDLLILYYQERFGSAAAASSAGVGVLRGVVGREKGGVGKGFERIYLDEIEEEEEDSDDSGDSSDDSSDDDDDDGADSKRTVHVDYWEEDEEYIVRSAVITAIASVRAKDGLTPQKAIDFLLKLIKAEADADGGNGNDSGNGKCVIGTTKTASKRSMEYGNTLAESYDLSYYTAQMYLSLCHVNVKLDDVIPGLELEGDDDRDEDEAMAVHEVPHPCMPLLEVCFERLEWELFKHNEDEEEGGGGGRSGDVAVCLISAVCSLALLKVCTGIGTGRGGGSGGGGKSVSVSDDDANENDASDDDVNDAAAKPFKIDQACTAAFYARIYENTSNVQIKASAAQALCNISCASDRHKDKEKGTNTSSALGLLTAYEYLLSNCTSPTTPSSLKTVLLELMTDCVTGKISTLHRCAVLSVVGRGGATAGVARWLNGPLGGTFGGDNASGVLINPGNVMFNPVANAVNNGAREGFKVLLKAGNDGKIKAEVVGRVVMFASKLWRLINGPSCASYDSSIRGAALAVWCRVYGVPGKLNKLLYDDNCPGVVYLNHWLKHPHLCPATVDLEGMKRLDEEEMEILNECKRRLKGVHDVETREVLMQRNRGGVYKDFVESYNKRAASVSASALENRRLGLGAGEEGKPASVIVRNETWKLGGWVSSAAAQKKKEETVAAAAAAAAELAKRNAAGVGGLGLGLKLNR